MKTLRKFCLECGQEIIFGKFKDKLSYLLSNCYCPNAPKLPKVDSAIIVVDEVRIHDDDPVYCGNCGEQYAVLNFLKNKDIAYVKSCMCNHVHRVHVPIGSIFVHDEQNDFDLKRIEKRLEFYHINVCELCHRPTERFEYPYWRCHVCGNQNKNKTTNLRIPRGVVYTWTEQRLNTHCEVQV